MITMVIMRKSNNSLEKTVNLTKVNLEPYLRLDQLILIKDLEW